MSKNFQIYLLENGKANVSDAEKAMLFEEFREIYLKDKNQQRKTKGKRIEILAPFDLDAKIAYLAQRLGISKSKLILQILGYYCNPTWVYPHEHLLNEIRRELGKIDSKYYQLVHFCYVRNHLHRKQIEQLLELQQIQKHEILETLCPRVLEDYFFERINEPKFYKKVAALIRDYKPKER